MGLHREISVRLAPARNPVRALLEGKDHQTGDRAFDAAVDIRGPERRLHAILSDPTRDRLHDHLRRGVVVRGGSLIWERPAGAPAELHALVRMAHFAGALAIHDGAIRPRLLRHLRRSVHTGVRVRCALALCDHRWAGREGVGKALDEGMAEGGGLAELVVATTRFATRARPERAAYWPESVLVALLDDRDLRAVVLRQLGARGTRAALPAVSDYTSGLFVAAEAKRAAREAAAAIERTSSLWPGPMTRERVQWGSPKEGAHASRVGPAAHPRQPADPGWLRAAGA